MSDGTETLDLNTPDNPASGEVETNSLPADTTSDEVQDLDALTDTSEEGQADEPDYSEADEDEEYEEVERNGKKYRIPKALSGELMMQQDYTRKTQTVAEERKALEAEKQAIAQQAERIKALDGDYRKLAVLDDYLERQSKLDWNRLWQEDPLDTPRKWAEYQHWQGQRAQLNSRIEAAEAERSEAAQLERAKRIQEAEETAKTIKGWTPEVGNKVAEQVKSYGFTQEQISDMVARYGGAAVKLAHEAFLGRQLIQQKQTAAKAPAVPQEPVKPLAPVVTRGANPAPRKSLSQMSMEEYVAARRAGRTV